MALPPLPPVALTIAGSDSGANAGIQADLLTFAANGVYGTTAITCLTAQNPTGVTAIHATTAVFIEAQLKQLLAYFPIKAAKTGMLFNREIIETVADAFEARPEIPLVVDPVSVASSGDPLLEPDAFAALKSRLLPLAILLTPNLDEAELLLERPLRSPEAMEAAAVELAQSYRAITVLKGGHLDGDELVDIVATPEGQLHRFTQQRIHYLDTHGSGCTLSAAITAHLALGKAPLDAIDAARHYLRRAMTQALTLPSGHFINHFPA